MRPLLDGEGKRACDNRRTYRLDRIKRAVVDAVVARLREPDAVRSRLDSVQAERRDDARHRARLERTLGSAEAKLDRLQHQLIDERASEEFFGRTATVLKAEVGEKRCALSAAPSAKVVRLHPAALSRMAEVLAIVAEKLLSSGRTARRARPSGR